MAVFSIYLFRLFCSLLSIFKNILLVPISDITEIFLVLKVHIQNSPIENSPRQNSPKNHVMEGKNSPLQNSPA